MNVRLLEKRTPFWVTEMRRDKRQHVLRYLKRKRVDREKESLFIYLLI